MGQSKRIGGVVPGQVLRRVYVCVGYRNQAYPTHQQHSHAAHLACEGAAVNWAASHSLSLTFTSCRPAQAWQHACAATRGNHGGGLGAGRGAVAGTMFSATLAPVGSGLRQDLQPPIRGNAEGAGAHARYCCKSLLPPSSGGCESLPVPSSGCSAAQPNSPLEWTRTGRHPTP